MDHTNAAKLRLDKWLWYARVVKTRSLAAKLVQSGNVRVNRDKVTSASYGVKVDDVLTIAVHERIRVLKIEQLGTRRGPASEAATLFEDLSPPPMKKEDRPLMVKTPSPERRPDKRERRTLVAFKSTFE